MYDTGILIKGQGVKLNYKKQDPNICYIITLVIRTQNNGTSLFHRMYGNELKMLNWNERKAEPLK